ncbi:MAG TPA: hypothetical protein VJM32_06040 [Candidatus Saccharimonadales bacterium]|nr:hypothetical protein [Candidatus Saccharimonadales bacterium]
MARHVASLSSVSLFTDLGYDKGHFTLSFEPKPEERRGRKRFKCSVVEWPAGELETIEGRLSSFRMPVIHEGDDLSYFWVRSKHLMVAIGLVLEALHGLYEFDPPEFWYNTPEDDASGIEFRLEDSAPDTHTTIVLECTTWRTLDRENPEPEYDAFVAALRQSELCIPDSVFYEAKGFNAHFYVRLTPDAAADPLTSFLALVNLHPELANTDGEANSQTG